MNIEFNDIELKAPDAGGGNVYYNEGLPFTGTIVEHISGILIGEISVVDGHTQGRVASYYQNGQLMEEYFEKHNRMYGLYRKWDINGVLETEVDYGPES
jgi:antitoxin component YwqK of YwqJK toxin-antitoxin module